MQQAVNFPFLQGGGEMGELIRNMDWSATPIGTPDQWSQSLRISLSNVLNSGFPMFLFWGAELTCFYNDAFRPSLGVEGKHPAIGKGGKEVWPEIWHFIGPLIESVLTTGKPVWFENQLVPFYRNGRIEDIYWTFSYSLIVNDDGQPGGVLVTCMETTETIRGRTQLLQSEMKVRNIIEQAPVAIALTRGVDLVFESLNPLMLQLIDKKDKQEVLGKSMAEVLPHLVNQPVYKIMLQVLQTGETFQGADVEVEMGKEDFLQRRYYNISYSRVVDSDGVPFVLHIATDVTNQVLIKRKREESEVKLRTILNSAPTAMGVFVGPDLIVENPNQLLIEVMAAGPDIEGKSFRELLSGLVEEDQKFIALIDNVRTTGVPFEAQEVGVYFNAEQKTRYFNISFIPLRDENGTVYAVLDVSVDVTTQVEARQKIEEKEAALARALEQVRLSKEAAELGTFDMDLEKGTMHWDDRCRTLFGISHQQPVTYEKDFMEGLHPDDRERILEVINKAFNKSISNGDYNVEYRTVGAEDGVIRWVKAKGKVYFNEQDKPVRFIGSVLDITEQITAIQKIEDLVELRTQELARSNEALLKTITELSRSNVYLEEFAHAASHDMKEPIRKILTFTDRLKTSLEGRMTETESALFGRVENATQRMGLLVDDLLEYSHVSERPLEKEEVDLNAKLKKVLVDLELLIEEKGARINISPLPMVSGYKRQLQQLFQNLVSNGLKYSKPDQAPIITVTSKEVTGEEVAHTIAPEDRAHRFHLIEVQDNGIGFEQQYAERIFGMFQRLHGKSQYPGTGVGLSIARKVVDNHNGYIWADSEPGKGATFTILLPAEV